MVKTQWMEKMRIVVDDDEISENGFDTVDEPDFAKIVEPSPHQKKSLNRKLSSTLADEAEVDDGGALMSDEFKERVIGSVSRQVYIDWAKAAGGIKSRNIHIIIVCIRRGLDGRIQVVAHALVPKWRC